jgi:hypothetical protein
MAPIGDCPACGSGGVTSERSGHLELLRCSHCGWEVRSTVFPGEEVPAIGQPGSVRARIHWHGGRATSSEIVAARKAIPALASEPLSRLLDGARDSAEYDLGEYSKSAAIELQERAKRYGLVVLLGASTE